MLRFVIVITAFVTLVLHNAYGQECGADMVSLRNRQSTVDKNQAQTFQHKWKSTHGAGSSQILTGVPFVKHVPVVFHVIHNNGQENIPDSLIIQQLDILNETFRRLPGTIGDGSGVDTEIEFCLASIDPSGNATTGITRTQSICTNDSVSGCANPADVIFWGDSQRQYLNIWVLRDIEGSSGYGGTFLHVAVRYNYVGRASIFNGRLVTHEVGHWLGLYHPFQGGCGNGNCASSGDYICDTPPVANASSGCPTGTNSCSSDVPDLNDLIENYMDYSLNCGDMFTQGQKDRMHGILKAINKSMFSAANLVATGCEECSAPPCVPVVDFYADKIFIAQGDTVFFTDNTYNVPASWQWNFSGGTPSTSSSSNPTGVVYNSLGTFDVTLICTNAAGTDTMILKDYITVIASDWEKVMDQCDGEIFDLIEYKDELYAAGTFDVVEGDSMTFIAKWDGNGWNKVGAGLSRFSSTPLYMVIEVYDGELYFGSVRHIINETGEVSNLSKWNGSNWSKVPGITGNTVTALFEFRGELCVSGGIDSINSLPISSMRSPILTWDGSVWDSLVSPVFSGGWGINDSWGVFDMDIYNGQLVTTGGIITGGNMIHAAGRLNNSTWEILGPEIEGSSFGARTSSINIYNGEIYVGGWYDRADGATVNHLSKWDGASWSSINGGVIYNGGLNARVYDLELFGNRLIVAGVFNEVGGQFSGHIASWDGINLVPMGVPPSFRTRALTVFKGELYAASGFFVSKWGCDTMLKASFYQDKDSINLAVDTSTTIQFTSNSTNANSWNWDFGDGQSDTIPDPIHSFDSIGTYLVRLSVSNGICSSTSLAYVYVNSTVGESVIRQSSRFNVYPNPNTGHFTLEMHLKSSTDISVRLYTIDGKLVYQKEENNISGNYSPVIRLNKYAKGVYFLQVITDQGVFTGKVMYK